MIEHRNLPAIEPVAQEPVAGVAAAFGSSTASISVLTADSSLSAARRLASRLESGPGFHCVGCTDNALALEALARAKSPQLIVTDLILVDGSVLNAVSRMTGWWRPPRVIVLGDALDPAWLLRDARARGASACLAKAMPWELLGAALVELAAPLRGGRGHT